MKKIFFLTLFFLQILRGVTTAQNPYKSIGKTTEVLTLSNGKYQEFFPNDTIVRIGSVLFNRVTNEVVEFLTEKDSSSLVEADVASRFLSVDPIGRKFPELTPYQFASNRPIDAIDLDGLEAFTMIQYEEFKRLKLGQSQLLLGHTSAPTYDVRTRSTFDIPYSTWSLKDNSFSITGPGENLISPRKALVFNHVFNGQTLTTTFNTSGVSTSIFNAPKLPIRTLNTLNSMSSTFAELKEGTILNKFATTLTERGVPEDTRNFALNAFRHIAFSTVMTFLYGDNTAKIIGDAHERDDTGFLANGQFYDSSIDIINNAYGRNLGNELKNGAFKGANLKDPSTLSQFLNRVFENVANAVPGLGPSNIFNPEQKEVKKLSEKID